MKAVFQNNLRREKRPEVQVTPIFQRQTESIFPSVLMYFTV